MTEWYDSYIWNFYYFKSDFQVVISFSIYLEVCYLIWQVRASTEKCYMCVFLTIRHQHECLLHTPGIWLFSNKNSEPWAIQLLLLYIFVMLTINTKLNCLHLVILLIGVVSICVGCARIWDMLLWVMKQMAPSVKQRKPTSHMWARCGPAFLLLPAHRLINGETYNTYLVALLKRLCSYVFPHPNITNS